jgi:hypothetical protein
MISDHGAALRALTLSALAAGAILLSPTSATAAKWSNCPADPQPAYPSTLGATNAPFIHPGHELRIMLNASQVAASGGFSLADAGNRVEIEFATLFGTPVALAPLDVAATSAAVLSFPFPDTAADLGREVTGPVGIRVERGDQLVARIDPDDLVALPPASDVTDLLTGREPQQTIEAALGRSGDLWVPASFHGASMAMPGCPGDFLIPLSIQVGAASIPGLTTRGAGPLDRIRRLSLYFGDVAIDGHSFYGALSPQRIRLQHVAGTRGVTLCHMNDVIDLVLRVRGSRSWARARRSPFASVVKDGAPVRLVLRAATPLPDAAAIPWRQTDSFGGSCATTPSIASGDSGGARR